MTDQEARYDRIAEGYATWWAPIHMPLTLQVVRRVAEALEGPDVNQGRRGALREAGEPLREAGEPLRILDAGCGTGLPLAAMAATRPDAQFTGVDLSAGMLEIARRNLARAAAQARVTLVQASIDRLPFADASFDVVTSAFVLQLVPNRHRALRELRRVLVPGGLLATLVWVAGAPRLRADDAYADVLDAHGLGNGPADAEDANEDDADATDHDDRDDPRDAAMAATRLRRAGFRRTTAEDGWLRHRFTPAAYLGFMRNFDDEDLWASLGETQAVALERDLLARLQELDEDALHLQLPVAHAMGRRPPGP